MIRDVEGFTKYGLNAPSGAQCFPTKEKACLSGAAMTVSMHLLVLSAFRLELYDGRCAQAIESQCTFWCSMLSDLYARSF